MQRHQARRGQVLEAPVRVDLKHHAGNIVNGQDFRSLQPRNLAASRTAERGNHRQPVKPVTQDDIAGLVPFALAAITMPDWVAKDCLNVFGAEWWTLVAFSPRLALAQAARIKIAQITETLAAAFDQKLSKIAQIAIDRRC